MKLNINIIIGVSLIIVNVLRASSEDNESIEAFRLQVQEVSEAQDLEAFEMLFEWEGVSLIYHDLEMKSVAEIFQYVEQEDYRLKDVKFLPKNAGNSRGFGIHQEWKSRSGNTYKPSVVVEGGFEVTWRNDTVSEATLLTLAVGENSDGDYALASMRVFDSEQRLIECRRCCSGNGSQ